MQHLHWQLQALGTPYGGTVTSVAISPNVARDRTSFAATMAGLYRSQNLGAGWQREPSGLNGLSLTAVCVSPAFADDGLVLVAGLECGVFRVQGGQWVPGNLGGRRVRIVALAISPDFSRDGTCFAATMADGIFRSQDRGAHWEPVTFGLLDLDVIALAISPTFARDEMVVAGTATGLFRSPNGGLAWRELMLPTANTAVLCVTFSPAFGTDGMLFAGTDGAGLFRSHDRGATWEAVPGPWVEHTINGIALSPDFADDRTMLLAADTGLYRSRDGGEHWTRETTAAALCVAVAPTFGSGGPILLGLSRAGIARSTGTGTDWHPANEGLAGRLLTGLAASPTFASDRRLVAYGPGEGLLRSEDGGHTWQQIDDALPSLHVTSTIVVGIGRDQHLFVALPEGIWKCQWETLAWEQVSEIAAQSLALSPAFEHDATLIAGTADGQLWVTEGGPATWRQMHVPWQRQQLLALSVSLQTGRPQPIVVLADPQSAALNIWKGTMNDGWEQLGHYPCTATAARIAGPMRGQTWYIAAADQLLGPVAGSANSQPEFPLPAGHPLSDEQPTILDLALFTGLATEAVLAASTGGLYCRQTEDQIWTHLDQDSPGRPIIALATIRNDRSDCQILALEVGGPLWCLQPSHQD